MPVQKKSGNLFKAPRIRIYIYIYRERERERDVGWLVGFHGISTFVGYLMPDPFLYK